MIESNRALQRMRHLLPVVMWKALPALLLAAFFSTASLALPPVCWVNLVYTTTVTNSDNLGNSWTITTLYYETLCSGNYLERDQWVLENPFSPLRFDDNDDGEVDHWKDVVKTTDQCANNFDLNDRLGLNRGGINTVRKTHNGVDIQANYNDPVRVIGDGVVRAVGWASTDHSADCGFWVQIDHDNGWRSYSCHLVANSSPLQVGARVYAGQFLGRADSTGNSTGNHLHIVYKKGTTRREYFDFVNQKPTSSQLNNNGC